MTKKNKIIIIGLGSIGQRHYRNLQSLGFTDVCAHEPDKEKVEKLKVPLVPKLTLKNLREFDIAFICNPTHLHVPTAIKCAQAGLHLFIEKPLSHNLRRIDALIQLCRQKKLITMVACNFRFHEGFRKLDELVKRGELGQPLTARVVIGHDLSKSRPGTDYRQTYAAKKDGGGVILDSGVHAIDYLSSLFGSIVDIGGIYGQSGELEIEPEDFAVITLKHRTGTVVSLMLDYFSKPKRHSIEIQFSQGWALWDFADDELSWYSDGEKKMIRPYGDTLPEEKRNVMYLAELETFMALISGEPVDNPQDLFHAKEVLVVIKEIKKQLKHL